MLAVTFWQRLWVEMEPNKLAAFVAAFAVLFFIFRSISSETSPALPIVGAVSFTIGWTITAIVDVRRRNRES